MDIANLFSKEKSCRLLVNLEGELSERYKWYREFLVHNHEALQIISDLERLQQGSEPFTIHSVKAECQRLFKATKQLVHALNQLSGGAYEDLIRANRGIQEQLESLFHVDRPPRTGDWVLPLEALTPKMADIAGSKATQLAAVRNELGLPIPDGFVITAHAFWSFIEENELERSIEEMLKTASHADMGQLASSTRSIQKRIMASTVPADLAQAIGKAYDELSDKTREGVLIAMRSTAVGEDTEASFAGQYKTVLNVGKQDLLNAYKTVIASKYAPRAIRYRMRTGLDDQSTPMCVAGIAMINARSSGVAYSRDPANPGGSEVLVSAIWGLGEHLVSGGASPDIFHVDRNSRLMTGKEISEKNHRMTLLKQGGTRLEDTPASDKASPAIDDKTALRIAEYCLQLETHFGTPQDVEWCVDQENRLFILQSRPLGMSQSRPQGPDQPKTQDHHSVILSTGKTASRGTASGEVFLASALKEDSQLKDAILVARTASPEYAKRAESLKGIITDLGSTASHLASVARELGIPMIVSAQNATATLTPGTHITMVADTATVYDGTVTEFTETSRLPHEAVFRRPVHQHLDAILRIISPLNLKDPAEPTFTPKHCKTLHDIIRYSHEKVVKEMFGISARATDSVLSVRMTASIPLAIYFIDLGGGLRENLTTCDDITPDAITSKPMASLWRGLSHPGVSWAGAVDVNSRNLMALMTSGPPPKMASYAVVSGEYLNLSMKFGYHYTTVDTLWTDILEDNYISLQFGGGAGSYHGRALRIHFLSEVLQSLGFMVQVSGDVLDATLKGLDPKDMDETLDQLGRLLASSRLLDLGISSQNRVDQMKTAFFSGDYNFLQQVPNPLPGCYTPTGDWTCVEIQGRVRLLQDGSASGEGFSCTLKNIMGKVVGFKYQRFLDSVQAYHYFPLAIVKDSYSKSGLIEVVVTLESGCINNMGGLAFGLKNVANFYVLCLDALEKTVSLLQFIKGKPVKHQIETRPIQSKTPYRIGVQINETTIAGLVEDQTVLHFEAEKPVEGYVGLWTKADAKVYFDELTIHEADKGRMSLC